MEERHKNATGAATTDQGAVKPLLYVDGFGKFYGSLQAVAGLSFDVRQGEILGLVGPNGAGKTTTLRAIAGIIPPSAGKILVDGRDLADDPIGAKRALAFIPDEPKLFDYLTVSEHLRFMARLYKTTDPKPDDLIAELELTGKESALPGALSRGMKQKLALACGLIHDPRVILLDEPLTGLDPVAIRRTKTILKERARQGAAILLSSHLLSMVEELANRVMVLQAGKLVVLGTIDELRERMPAMRQGANLEDIFLAVTGNEEKGPIHGD